MSRASASSKWKIRRLAEVGGVRRQLTVLMVMLTLVAGWACWDSAPPRLSLHLVLSRAPQTTDWVEGDCLVVEVEGGQAHTWSRENGVMTAEREIALSTAEEETLRQNLTSFENLEDVDFGQPEKEVLYTRLDLNGHRSRWRGLGDGSPQHKCAGVLLASPLGPSIQFGIGRLMKLQGGAVP